MRGYVVVLSVVLLVDAVAGAGAELVVDPPAGTAVAAGQRFDLRACFAGPAEVQWEVTLDGVRLEPTQQDGRLWMRRRVEIGTAGVHRVRVEARDPSGTVVGVEQREVEVVAWRGTRASRARNVILLVGDGMGLAHRVAARTFLHGVVRGKPGSRLAMERLPVGGFLSTSSLSGLVTDSAAAAHALATGTKTGNEMLGVFPDQTPDRDDDNAGLEQLPSLLARTRGMVAGVVTTDRLFGATPAGFFAHTADRGEGAAIGRDYLEAARDGVLRVMLGGGAQGFAADEGRLQNAFAGLGFAVTRTAGELTGVMESRPGRLLGLFHDRAMSSELDRQKRGDPEVVKSFPDQPSLEAMTRAALAVLAPEPHGFFLMVESSGVDTGSHAADQERMVWDVLALDRAVAAAMELATRTNSDRDPTNDTLVIVTADHETGGVVLPGVLDPARSGREAVRAYDLGGFPEALDANGDHFPDRLDPGAKPVVHFGAGPDRYEDWRSQPRPVSASAGRRGVDRHVYPNPERDGGTGVLLSGVTPTELESAGYSPTSCVHTAVDVPLAAFGPGAERLGGVHDNTEVFLAILQSLGGA